MSFTLARSVLRSSLRAPSVYARSRIHTSPRLLNGKTALNNILAGDIPPPVQVKTISNNGIELADGLVLTSASIFLDGKVFLWDVPQNIPQDWDETRFRIFEIVVPKPEILFIGTGKTITPLPPPIRSYLNNLGIQVDVMDTWNACSTYNLLAEEGRRVAAAVIPWTNNPWPRGARR